MEKILAEANMQKWISGLKTARNESGQYPDLNEKLPNIYKNQWFMAYEFTWQDSKKGLKQILIMDKIDGDLIEVKFWAKLSSNKQSAAERQPIRGIYFHII